MKHQERVFFNSSRRLQIWSLEIYPWHCQDLVSFEANKPALRPEYKSYCPCRINPIHTQVHHKYAEIPIRSMPDTTEYCFPYEINKSLMLLCTTLETLLPGFPGIIFSKHATQ